MATKVEEPVEANNQTLQPPPPRHAGGRKPKDILIRAQVDIAGRKLSLHRTTNPPYFKSNLKFKLLQ